MQTAKFVILFLFLMPLAYAWSSETHAGMCEKIALALNLPNLAEGCIYPDRKGDFQNHICHKDWCPAKRKAQIHLEVGRNLFIDGKSEAAFQFGTGCHYISDSLQPYHTKPSSSQKHLAFEQIAVAFAEPEETEKTFDGLNEEARLALDGITDDNAASLANDFANRAMNLCFTLIKREMQNRTKTEVPDCSSIEKILRNEDCHLRDVKLSGKIKSPLKRVSQRGNEYTIFYLSDGRNTIKAFAFGSLDLQDGALAEVEGTYYRERKTGNYWFYEEIDASSVREQNFFLLIGIVILLIVVVIVAVVMIGRKVKM